MKLENAALIKSLPPAVPTAGRQIWIYLKSRSKAISELAPSMFHSNLIHPALHLWVQKIPPKKFTFQE